MSPVPKKRSDPKEHAQGSEDPIWKDRAAPLIPFLREPRDWTDLLAWARDHHMQSMVIRNTLAWLSINGLVEAAPMLHKGTVQWVWMLRAVVEEEPIEAEESAACKHCGGFTSGGRCLMCGRPS